MKTILSYHLFLFCMLLSFLGNGQFILVTGNIIDVKTESALESVNIFESKSAIGTITNESGFFSMMLKPGKAEFVFSHEGFKDYSQNMILKNDTTLNVSMKPVLNLKSRSKSTAHQKTAENISNPVNK